MQEIRDDLKAIRSDTASIKTDIAVMKVDVAHHIKRSDGNERRIERVELLLLTLACVGVLGGVVRLLIS